MTQPKSRLSAFARLLRDGWLMVGLTLALFAMAELAARAYYLIRKAPAASESGEVDWRLSNSVFDDSPWAEQYCTELNEKETELVPYLEFRAAQYDGEYLSINAEGRRTTANETPQEDARITVLMLGGSTMMGTGARDAYTIPSWVSRQLAANGVPRVHVVNLGQPGYVSTQEVILLLLELRAGATPDIVIFYDGVNDTYASYQNRVAGYPQNESMRQQRIRYQPGALDLLRQNSALIGGLLNLRDRLLAPGRDESIQDAEALADETISVYLANTELVSRLAEVFHFEAYWFWQPTVFSKATPSEEERVIAEERRVRAPVAMALMGSVYAKMPAIAADTDGIWDLQGVLDGTAETIFIDWMHKSETGNRMVAEAMTEVLLTRSSVLATARPGVGQ